MKVCKLPLAWKRQAYLLFKLKAALFDKTTSVKLTTKAKLFKKIQAKNI